MDRKPEQNISLPQQRGQDLPWTGEYSKKYPYAGSLKYNPEELFWLNSISVCNLEVEQF